MRKRNAEKTPDPFSLAALYAAEADATRRIVRAAYHDPSARCAKAAADAWGEAQKRFAAGAPELLKLLSKP